MRFSRSHFVTVPAIAITMLISSAATASAADLEVGEATLGEERIEVDFVPDAALLEYVSSLSDAEAETFVEEMIPDYEIVHESTVPISTARAEELMSVAEEQLVANEIVPAAASCYSATYARTSYSSGGNKLWTYRHTYGYCFEGRYFTSAWLGSTAGTPIQIGWTYKGVIQTATGVIANAVRTWSQAKFELGAYGVVIQTAQPCIRGVKTQVNNLSNTSWTHSCYQ